MTATNHALGGALVATAVSQPLAAVVIAFALHFFMDMMPHFGVEGKNPQDMMSKSRLFRHVIRTDTLMFFGFMLILPFTVNAVSWAVVFACMIACVAPDFVWAYRFLRERTERTELEKNRFSRFHSWLQFRESPKGLIFELIWLGSMLWLLIV